MLFETVAALAVPWFAGQFADGVLGAAVVNVQTILLVLLALFAVQAAIRFTNAYVLSRTGQQILADLRVRIYDHLQALPLSFYHQRQQGEIMALLSYEVAHLSSYLTGTLLRIPTLLLTLVGAVVLMFRIDPALAIPVAILVPVFYIVMKLIGRRLRPLAAQLQQAQASAYSIANENLGILPAIKTFTREAENRSVTESKF